MRLLDTTTLTFHDFGRHDAPEYAILSHVWGSEELTYQEMLNPSEATKAKSGYEKLRNFARKSRDLACDYCWIDTCCIDKTSSAELTESINSMYAWYRDSAFCVIYLADVAEPDGLKPIAAMEVDDKFLTQFEHSRWFKRGWCLQELIAPKWRIFFSQKWNHIWMRNLNGVVSRITSIPEHVLESGLTDDLSVAQKMSWASNRQTTRVEDIAYCLLGIFDVNMPLLYGEGEKAFIRLQEEIIRRSADHTIFLWTDPTARSSAIRGMLARHPSEFAHCGDMAQHEDLPIVKLPYSLTNIGVQLSLRLVPLKRGLNASKQVDGQFLESRILNSLERFGSEYYVPILHSRALSEPRIYSVVLRRLDRHSNHFLRVLPHSLMLFDQDTSKQLSTFAESQERIAAEDAFCLPLIEQIYVYPSIRVYDLYRTQQVTGFLVKTDGNVDINHWHHFSSWSGDILEYMSGSSSPYALIQVRVSKVKGAPYVAIVATTPSAATGNPGEIAISVWKEPPVLEEIQNYQDAWGVVRRGLKPHDLALVQDRLVARVRLTRALFVPTFSKARRPKRKVLSTAALLRDSGLPNL